MGKLGQLGRSANRRPIIGVTGCMAMAKKESLFRKLPHLDFVIGTNNITDLDNVLDEVLTTGRQTDPHRRPIRRKSRLPECQAGRSSQSLCLDHPRLRQILHLLRRPLYARPRSLPPPREHRRRVPQLVDTRAIKRSPCSDKMSIATAKTSPNGTAFSTTCSTAR